jgi:GTP-binding protein HflX
VADVGNPAALDQISAVYGVLEELGIEAKDTLLVLNKVDMADRGRVASVMTRYPNALTISAHTGQGLDRLASAVSQTLSHNFLDLDVETGVENGRLLAQLAAVGEILSKRFTDTRVIVHCRVPERAVAHLYGEGVSIRPRGGVAADGPNGNGHAAPLPWPLDGSLVPRVDSDGSRH